MEGCFASPCYFIVIARLFSKYGVTRPFLDLVQECKIYWLPSTILYISTKHNVCEFMKIERLLNFHHEVSNNFYMHVIMLIGLRIFSFVY
jgi:hypothetical protein